MSIKNGGTGNYVSSPCALEKKYEATMVDRLRAVPKIPSTVMTALVTISIVVVAVGVVVLLY